MIDLPPLDRSRNVRAPESPAGFVAGSLVALLICGALAATGCSGRSPETPPAATESTESAGSRIVRSAALDKPLPRQSGDSAPPGATTRSAKEKIADFHFENVASALGIEFVYDNGASAQRLMIEATGGGGAWLDYDRDGLVDLYLCQGGDPTRGPDSSQPSDHLFRNYGSRFAAVTVPASVEERRYGQGAAAADYDNDGFDDIYVTNVGPNTLFRNMGDGTFDEVAAAAGVAGNLWSSSAAWGDLDRDGNLDLYVCNYVDFDPLHPRVCRNARGIPAMCHPNQMEAVPDECYFNLGDGTFAESAHERGLYGPGNKALGVVIADLNNDDWPDVYVANDTTPNFLFLNGKDARFVEKALALGCAVSAEGVPQASMGIAIGDYDQNGFLDLYVTHFLNEWNTLYRNLGPRGLHDVTALVGLVKPTLPKLAFGTIMADLNADGRVELFVANGHIDDHRDEGLDWAMTPQLFTFDGRRFHDVSAAAGRYFHQKVIGRGVAMADFDRDGDVDLAVVHHDAPAALLSNESPRAHWLGVRLLGRTSNRSAIGARVVLRKDHGDPEMQELVGGSSFASSHEKLLMYGLGESSAACDLEIRWPSGIVTRLSQLPVDRFVTVLESDSPELPRDSSKSWIDPRE